MNEEGIEEFCPMCGKVNSKKRQNFCSTSCFRDAAKNGMFKPFYKGSNSSPNYQLFVKEKVTLIFKSKPGLTKVIEDDDGNVEIVRFDDD